MIYDDYSFIQTAKTFYDNGDCNSLEEFETDISRIVFIGNHFNRFDRHGTTNIPLLLNHFISFINCFGFISEELLNYKLPHHFEKINSLFVFIGNKTFDGETKIDEELFIALQMNTKKKKA